MEEKQLYPLRFIPIEDNYVWGSEIFKIADLGYRDTIVASGWLAANEMSEVMDTYMDRVSGEGPFGTYGRQFPVQLKSIVCKGKMPIRVHPDDEIADQRYDALGKEKLWYIASAGADAKLYLGWKEQLDATKVIESAKDGSLPSYLNIVTPKAGECFRIRPGVVHGCEGNLEIVEVSQSSALDFCLYSWGKQVGDEEFDASMSIVEALDFIDYGAYRSLNLPASTKNGMKDLIGIPQFTARKIELSDPLHISGGDSFAIYLCLYGEAAVQVDIEGLGDTEYVIKRGECLLVPAEVDDFILKPLQQTTSVMEVFVETHPAKKSEEAENDR